MTGQDIIGIINIFVVGAGFSVPFILASNKRAKDNFDKLEAKIDKKFDDIEKGIAKANAELLPAYRNGGIVTSEKLNSSITFLEKTLSDKIDFIHKSINNHNDSSSMRGSLTEERIIELIKKARKP